MENPYSLPVWMDHATPYGEPLLKPRRRAQRCGHFAHLSREKFGSNVVEKCVTKVTTPNTGRKHGLQSQHRGPCHLGVRAKRPASR